MRGARGTCEAHRIRQILEGLRRAAGSGSKTRGFELLKRDPTHPSLQFKKIGRFWSVRVGLRYRALAVEADGAYVWFWIGSHAEYDRLIS